ncbi:hypothetical protein [Streptomyces sp. NBC_01264]|uniref:hypothetical protein n=1 Tax=Streptomyces sp. NBC_01264 TaxID=2903804 RepID=UPI00224D08CB|nr:hypothetical protein [Streptomyces sp. NBC_01264]MCX4781503.1 hypothetical protein [Streptomyces sp. NBC_01264]
MVILVQVSSLRGGLMTVAISAAFVAPAGSAFADTPGPGLVTGTYQIVDSTGSRTILGLTYSTSAGGQTWDSSPNKVPLSDNGDPGKPAEVVSVWTDVDQAPATVTAQNSDGISCTIKLNPQDTGTADAKCEQAVPQVTAANGVTVIEIQGSP